MNLERRVIKAEEQITYRHNRPMAAFDDWVDEHGNPVDHNGKPIDGLNFFYMAIEAGDPRVTRFFYGEKDVKEWTREEANAAYRKLIYGTGEPLPPEFEDV
ncbi:hypothetical protein [Aliagarivorans taiwanensis]|uniref:hypothetical protein n=1 Tax=Aliagarivorans taiwanensis TaxID=561966 RepID=UPI00047D74B2|nr:hypothetical protein [Aliagarivorans taiwanensis]